MTGKPQKSALLIAGPTASGKSALAMRLAMERNGIIINADSMQVYRELRILTARPTVEEEAAAPHRLYGHASGVLDYSVARWRDEAVAEIEACWGQQRLPILCGGTGLYFRALEEGLAAVPPIAPGVRQHWREFKGDLHKELAKRDPAMAQRLRPTDRQRITRALEVVESTGKSLLDWQEQQESDGLFGGVSVERLYVQVDRDELYIRADKRFDAMVEKGALEEVRRLPSLPPEQPIMKAIGVPELSAHLRGECSLGEAVVRAKLATRRYIKRQLTWWRPRLDRWTVVT